MEELQEADVLWPWPEPDTPLPSSPGWDWESYLPAPAAPELYEPFGDVREPAASSISSFLTLSALPSDYWSSSDGFFLSSPSTVFAGLDEIGATEEFLEADVLWPDTADEEEDDGAAGFGYWRRCSRRRVEETAAAAPLGSRGRREARSSRPQVSSPIDIPVATSRAAAAAARRRLPTTAVAALTRRRW